MSQSRQTRSTAAETSFADPPSTVEGSGQGRVQKRPLVDGDDDAELDVVGPTARKRAKVVSTKHGKSGKGRGGRGQGGGGTRGKVV